jgi:hypothetical protein
MTDIKISFYILNNILDKVKIIKIIDNNYKI